jgi:NADPH:quinone reductase-like Zn-dependent oxidoreductase
LTIDWDLVFLIPEHMSYESASTIPLCALTAAQGAFFRMGMPSPFWQPDAPPEGKPDFEASNDTAYVFVYGSATSLGMFAAQMVQLAKKVSKREIKLIGAASAKHMPFLKAAPYSYDEIVDYHDEDWPAQVKAMTGGKGLDYAIDGISELPMVIQINDILNQTTGHQAIFRSPRSVGYVPQWEKMARKPEYGAVWEGLRHDIRYASESLHVAAARLSSDRHDGC